MPSCWAGQSNAGNQTGALLAKVATLEGDSRKDENRQGLSQRMAAPPHLCHPYSNIWPETLPHSKHDHTQTHPDRSDHKQTSKFAKMYPTAPSAPLPSPRQALCTHTHSSHIHTWAYTDTQWAFSRAHMHPGRTPHMSTQAHGYSHMGTHIHTLP